MGLDGVWEQMSPLSLSVSGLGWLRQNLLICAPTGAGRFEAASQLGTSDLGKHTFAGTRPHETSTLPGLEPLLCIQNHRIFKGLLDARSLQFATHAVVLICLGEGISFLHWG